jgi:sensor histidine kinase YesM
MKKAHKLLKYFSILTINVGFWIGVYFFYTYFLGYGSSNTEYVNRFSWYLMPITIVLSYFVILYLIPNYLRKRKHKLFILYGIYTIIISFAVVVLSIFYGFIFSSYLKDADTAVLTKSVPLIILGVYFVVIVAVFFRLLFDSYQSSLRTEDLKNKVLEAQLRLKQQELKFLKMQIHPHFLFNSLNTIYGYALKKEEQAPEMILKLSNLLDYILYQVEKPSVLLENELNHVEDYVALEKIRFHDTLDVTIQKKGTMEGIAIAPMLLIPFVENSFKHGSLVDGKLTIAIRLEILADSLFFEISNSAKNKEVLAQGIGLENIQKRLEMLYKNRYDLQIDQNQNMFTVRLTLNLKSPQEL